MENEILQALSTGHVEMLLIVHSDGRVTLHTTMSPGDTGAWLVALGESMMETGDSWVQEPTGTPLEPVI